VSLKTRIDQLVQRAADFLLSVCFSSGNLPSSLESSHADRLIHWCHGASGFIHFLAHAYRVSQGSYFDIPEIDCILP
jgi:hypothetical protein